MQGSFAFDKVFGMDTKQQDIFAYSIKSIVDGKFYMHRDRREEIGSVCEREKTRMCVNIYLIFT